MINHLNYHKQQEKLNLHKLNNKNKIINLCRIMMQIEINKKNQIKNNQKLQNKM